MTDAEPRDAPSPGGISASDAATLAGEQPTLGVGSNAAVTQPEPRSTAVAAPTRIGRFVVLRILGEGAMGRVYAAYDEKLDRRVAIKVLHRGVDEDAQQRALREAKAMAKLSHPNVVQVYEIEEHERKLCIAMELVEGETLERWQAESERTTEEVLEVYLQAGEGLVAAHAQGLIHRDFKPQNVMVQPQLGGAPRVRVLDFGIARLAGGSLSRPEVPTDETLDPKLTATGSLLGTPAYMAPEQFMGSRVDAAADQFAFCVALWEGLYGDRPFGGDSLPELMASITSGVTREPARRGAVPASVHRALRRGLSAAADDRYPSMRQLLDALHREPEGRRRRRAWWAVGVLGAIAFGGLGVDAWLEARAARCSGASERLEEAWGAARRQQIQRRMNELGVPYAEDAWQGVAVTLDRYADDWRAQYEDACEATTVRGERSAQVMDLRMACLARARSGLAVVSNVLADADAAVLEHAAEMMAELPPLTRCADITALRADVEPPSADEAEDVARIRRLAQEASAEVVAGRHAVARERIQQMRQQLDSVEYAPVHAEAAVTRGTVLMFVGDYDESEAQLRDALRRAARHRQWHSMQEAATLLIRVVGVYQARPAEGLHYRELAEGLAAEEPRARAQVHYSLALVSMTQGEFAAAEAELRELLGLLEDADGSYDGLADDARNNLANALSKQGHAGEAEAEHRRLLSERQSFLGPDHPKVAVSRHNLAMALHQQGRYEDARTELNAAIRLRQRVFGDDSVQVAESRGNLAGLLVAMGRYEDAQEETRKVLAIPATTAEGKTHHAGAWNSIAVAHYWQGRYAEAEGEYRRSLEILEELHGSEHPDVVTARSNIAGVLGEQGKLSEAEREYRAALAISVRSAGSRSLAAATIRDGLAVNLDEQQRYEEAEAEFRIVLETREQTQGTDHPDTARARQHLATTLLELDRAEEARPLAEAAWARMSRGDLPAEERAYADFTLARALWETGDDAERRRAHELARRALEVFESTEQGYESILVEVRAWLADRPAP